MKKNVFIQNTDTKTTKDEFNIELSGNEDDGMEQIAQNDLSVSIILPLSAKGFLIETQRFQ